MTTKYTTDNKVTMHSIEDDVNERLISVLGDKFVDYRKKWNAVNKFELDTEFPLYLQVELNQICNLRCPMCSIGAPDANTKYVNESKMDWNVYEKIILEGEKYGCPSLNPQGINEPLLEQNLEDHIKFASKHGFFDIMMNTNATLLSEERSRKLLDSGLTRIRFSLDAFTKETYEKIRIGGKFDTVIKNIERFIQMRNETKNKLPVIGVNFVKMSTNEHEIESFIEKWQDSVDFIAIQEFMPPELDSDYSYFYPSNSKYREDMKKGFKCQQPWQRFYIHNTGQVCPCCAFFNSELSVGNIKEKTIHEMWNSPRMKDLRNIHKQGEFWKDEWCKKCVMGTCGINESDVMKIQKLHESNSIKF